MTIKTGFYKHWNLIDQHAWSARFPHFSPDEVACNGTQSLLVTEESLRALDGLQAIRRTIGKPLKINSGYRPKKRNKAVGGVSKSQHLTATAFDISMQGHDPEAFIRAALACGAKGIGTSPSSNFIHVDFRDADRVARWGVPFIRRAPEITGHTTPIEAEQIPRTSLAKSRTMHGGAAASTGMTGVGVTEMLSSTVDSAKTGLSDYTATSDLIKYAFMALVLVGVAVMIYARIDDWRRLRR